jgi:hypothetical protein
MMTADLVMIKNARRFQENDPQLIEFIEADYFTLGLFPIFQVHYTRLAWIDGLNQ